uniref:Putative secreted protein n=1 Tax=Anopheles darlingi TaxID=43151 RepID=A0A2M4DIA0_ANODA
MVAGTSSHGGSKRSGWSLYALRWFLALAYAIIPSPLLQPVMIGIGGVNVDRSASCGCRVTTAPGLSASTTGRKGNCSSW